MRVHTKVDARRLNNKLAKIQTNVERAAIKAINWTAYDAKDTARTVMTRVFDRPTPYALNGLFVLPATIGSPTATVGVRQFGGKGTAAASFLRPAITGQRRNLKRFERALQAVGAMPTGMYAVPGAAARLDAYGNMSKGQIVQILGYFRAFPENGYRANITDKRKASMAKGSKSRYGISYFVSHGKKHRVGARSWQHGRSNHLHAGVWQRLQSGLGSRVKPVLIYVNGTTHRRRFPFRDIVAGYARKRFAEKFRRALGASS